MIKRKINITFLLILVSTFASSQILERSLYNEKVYLATDKDIYNTKDIMRVKAFVVDSWEHKPDSVSKYVYVEVLDYNDNMLIRRKLRKDSLGMSTYFYLDSTFIVGNYYLRAYTQPMKYIDPEYLFIKQITVSDGDRQEVEMNYNGEVISEEKDYNVDFYIEGGNMVRGATQRVVIKCTDKNGAPVFSEGMIKNNLGDTISEIKTLRHGFGEFTFTSGTKQSYYYTDKNGQQFDINLPVNGPSVRIVSRENQLRYKVDGLTEQSNLTIHAHGGVIHATNVDSDKNSGVVDITNMKPGVICFTLADNENKVISERLYYINKPSSKIDLNIEERVYFQGEVITDQLTGQNIEGDFLVTIVNKNQLISPILKSGITSNILLQSDVKQLIINPDYLLFDTSNTLQNMAYIDMIMISEKWDRFFNLDLDSYDFACTKEVTECIGGRIKSGKSRVTKATIFGNVLDDVYSLDVNSNGEFYTNLPDFVGQSDFFIQPTIKNDKAIISDILIRDEYFPEITNKINFISDTKLKVAKRDIQNSISIGNIPQKEKYILTPINRAATNKENLTTYSTKEIKINGTKQAEPIKSTEDFYQTSKIQGDDIFRYSNFNIASAVGRLVGVSVIEGMALQSGFLEYAILSTRGGISAPVLNSRGEKIIGKYTKSAIAGCAMNVFVDGVQTPTTEALMMDPDQVKSIERVNINKSGVLFGGRGFCGSIIITTKGYEDIPETTPMSKGTLIQKQGYYNNVESPFRNYFFPLSNLASKQTLRAPSEIGNYFIKIEGISKNGIPYEAYREIKVE